MYQELEFQMRDGLIIKGQLEGNINSENLVVMLHSGGYDRHERGAKDVIATKKPKTITYYNELGNYDYLTNLLKEDYCILRIDQRNHGASGKNIDVDKLTNSLKINHIPEETSSLLISSLLTRDKATLNKLEEENPSLSQFIHRPPTKDMSFIEMKNDFKEVMEMLPKKIGKDFKSIDYIGTCMGTVVLGLYLAENPEKANSLTLFSPLFTFEHSFINPPASATFLTHKQNIVNNGEQFRIGNAVEGPSTIEEVESFHQTFLPNLANLDIPILCLQGTNDILVPADIQREIFKHLKTYREENNLAETNYEELPGVHCLYDVIDEATIRATTFINENKPLKKHTYQKRLNP